MPQTIVLEQFSLFQKRAPLTDSESIRQRIYILPTRQGFLFALMLCAMLLGAINYNNSMAFLLTFFLGALGNTTILHTYKNLAGLKIREMAPTPVFAGELAKFPLLIDNRDGSERIALAFDKLPRRKWWRQFMAPSSTDLAPMIVRRNIEDGAIKRVDLNVKTRQRGVLNAGRIRFFTTFPLGLFKAWSYLDLRQTCLVYPAPRGERALPPPLTAQITGAQGNTAGNDDFIGFRKYREGDALKEVAWKAYAQGKGLFIKCFSGRGAERLRLGWNDVAHFPDVEARLSQLCLWILEAESQSLHYRLELPKRRIDIGGGGQHARRCLSVLALYGLGPEINADETGAG